MGPVEENNQESSSYRLVTLPLHHLFPSSATASHIDTSPTSSTDQGENNLDVDPDKPSRALIACVACRNRKIKCSGDRPVCKTCAKSSQTCIYTPHAKRKRKAKVQISGDEANKRVQAVHPPGDTSETTVSSTDPLQSLADPSHLLSVLPAGIPALGVPGPSTYAQNACPPTASQYQNDLLPGDTNTSNGGSGNGLFSGNGFNPSEDLDFMNSLLSWQPPMTDASDPVTQGIQGGTAWNLDDILGWDSTIISSRDEQLESAKSQTQIDPSAQVEQINPVQKQKSRFRVPYFRFFGPTAIAPGYKQVQYDASAPPSPSHLPRSLPTLSAQDNTAQAAVMDDNEQYPHPDALDHLIPIFILHFSYFFPFLRYIGDDIASLPSTAPPYLLNIICALSARFSSRYGSRCPSGNQVLGNMNANTNMSASRIWASKAKEQVSTNLSISTVETVEALILISWYEFGQDRDGGLWMYSGMGLRMGQDLGLDSFNKPTSRSVMLHDPAELPTMQLHCSLVMMDAIMTIGTGRTGMYLTPRAAIPVLPDITRAEGDHQPDPFFYLVKVLVLVDNVARILRDAVEGPQEPLLEAAQSDLNEFHTGLPVELRFETSTFQKYASMGHGSTFVLLHLWFHTLIILVYQPSLLGPFYGDTNQGESYVAGRQIAASSAKTILDIASFAELIDPKANTQPWNNYPLYIAGCMFLSQSVLSSDEGQSAGQIHLAKNARANFQRIIGLMDTLQSYWAGVRYIRGALLQKAEGATQISLLDNVEDTNETAVPSALSAIWSGQTDTNDLVGLSFTGTMNSPTDNFFSLVYPQTPARTAPKGSK